MEMDRPITPEKTGEIFCHMHDGENRESGRVATRKYGSCLYTPDENIRNLKLFYCIHGVMTQPGMPVSPEHPHRRATAIIARLNHSLAPIRKMTGTTLRQPKPPSLIYLVTVYFYIV